NGLAADWIEAAKKGFEASGDKQRLFGEFYYAAKSWKCERRVIARIEHMEKGANPRYIVTNLEGPNPGEPILGDPDIRNNGQYFYETTYCARGDMENRIKEQQLDLFADRTSCHKWWPNQFRLLLSALAYTLLETVRRIALKDTGMAHVQCGMIRLRLLKIVALIVRNTRRVRFMMSSACPDQALFCLAAPAQTRIIAQALAFAA
ncbi:MAG: hypothetical protein GY761_21880, partial [Hyphomicrobiales bacterium]|nr:hypothetical protein [Hyphomicrobiales bacterium]